MKAVIVRPRTTEQKSHFFFFHTRKRAFPLFIGFHDCAPSAAYKKEGKMNLKNVQRCLPDFSFLVENTLSLSYRSS
jgi:hypothetical protein